VEKLFMVEIGFDAASIGAMAAAYAAVVPFLEIPSGVLADRWSRRGVLVIAHIALSASALVGGLATNIPTYLAAALLLGVFFAMRSGTLDALVYDAVVEVTGTSHTFERVIGRVRIWESSALVVSALGGGGVAALTSPRVSYFLTVPFGVASVFVLLKLVEPKLHSVNERMPLRTQIKATYRVLLAGRTLRPVIASTVLTAIMLQAVLEFGPLWMIALAAPAFLYGPHWAGLMAAFGIGGVLAGRTSMSKTGALAVIATLLAGASTALVVSRHLAVVITAQIVIAVVVVAVGAHLSRLLHDQIPSHLRAGVASGTGTLTWVAFLPTALVFGTTAHKTGVSSAAWLLVGIAVLTAVSVVLTARNATNRCSVPTMV
jgi:MFS family permease